ncbi:putative ALA-interacting subunit 1 [Blattamonas nauphoetae]|uniref:ALA-interacting subunit 1 n=1 Tax=Blattamonas nauphoetae TaxID=2049346 RepID=A0ABQ9XXS7_9EUKA|nr:putative ALA-interacting subunit 1 [Blattamonas nauphoetae]
MIHGAIVPSGKKPPKNWSIPQQTTFNLKPRSTPLVNALIFLIISAVATFLCVQSFHTWGTHVEIKIPFVSEPYLDFEISTISSLPLYIYYGFSEFYYTHRRYTSSRNDGELNGKSISETDLEYCDPRYQDGDTEALGYPCGLISASLYNESFILKKFDESIDDYVVIDPSDDPTTLIKTAESKIYKCKDGQCTDLPGETGYDRNISDPHFQVWMKPAAFPEFRKVYAMFPDGLQVGKYRVDIHPQTNLNADGTRADAFDPFRGKKYFILASKAWMGKKSKFLPVLLTIIAILAFAVSLFFIIAAKWQENLQKDYLNRHEMNIEMKTSIESLQNSSV